MKFGRSQHKDCLETSEFKQTDGNDGEAKALRNEGEPELEDLLLSLGRRS